MSIAKRGIQANGGTLRVHTLEEQNLNLEENLGAQSQVRHQLEMLHRDAASQVKAGSNPNSASWIHLENEANQREVIALEQKTAQLEKELNEVRQIIERMRNPYLGATVKDIEDLTAIHPPKLSQRAINKRIKKLQDNDWLPVRHPQERNTLYFFDKEQVRIILTYPRKKKPIQKH